MICGGKDDRNDKFDEQRSTAEAKFKSAVRDIFVKRGNSDVDKKESGGKKWYNGEMVRRFEEKEGVSRSEYYNGVKKSDDFSHIASFEWCKRRSEDVKENYRKQSVSRRRCSQPFRL